MVRERQSTPMSELWSHSSWKYFDIYNAVTTTMALGREPNPNAGIPFSLHTQQHIDVRTFLEGAWEFDGVAPYGISLGYLSVFNNAPGATISAAAGVNVFTSSYTEPIDLTVLDDVNARMVLTIPNLPAAQVDLAASYLVMASDNTHTVSVPWTASTTSPVTDHYLSFPYSAFSSIDLTHLTQVKIVIGALNDVTFHVLALRLVHEAWMPTSVDFNNLQRRLQKSIPLDANNDPYPPNLTVPTLWRAAEIPGIDDPRPIDAEISFVFNTGSQTGLNSFSLYLREVTRAFMTQTALDGFTQAMLTGKAQPIDAAFETLPRPMSDLDTLSMSQLQGESMHNLEAVADAEFASWIRFSIHWGLSPHIDITNALNPSGGFQYTNVSFDRNTSYVAICNLTDGKARMQLYTIDQDTYAIENLMFDTTEIPDDFFFPRRPGRLGVQGIFSDGDAWVGPVRPRSLMFAEYRSRPLKSITPVKGARLYAQNTAPVELFTNWGALGTPTLPFVTDDQQRFVPGSVDPTSTKVTVAQPGVTAQGLISNVLSPDEESGITDFDQLHIQFSLWVPRSTMFDPLTNTKITPIAGATILRAGLVTALGAPPVEFRLPAIIPDQWQTINIFRPMSKPYPQSGPYRLVLLYYGSVPTTFWVDEASVHQHVVRWDGRSMVDDPWYSNYAPWTVFHENINSDVKEIGFTTQGSDLQIRGQALAQAVAIVGAPKVVPLYAELGRMVWPENQYVSAGSPTATVATDRVGRSYTFTATASSPNGIANYEWSFGDGTFGIGPVVIHEYPAYLPPGTTFTVNLTVWDRADLSYSPSPTSIALV